ncbi:hypothetical protein OQA88_441 [Cercophora sp. LCS_1]
MSDTENASALKRKASLSPRAEDEALKRVKTDSGRGDTQLENHGDVDSGERRKGANENGSGLKQASDDELNHERSTRADNAASPRRSTDADAATKLSAEAKRAGPWTGRRNFSQEEKKRGQRLFGGLLSTLSQTTSNTQQRKRLDIERRQYERAQQQRVEDDRRRADKLAKLNHVRKIEQIKLDEQVMDARHSNMLSLAHSLETRSEPRLYYRPWELTQSEERIVDEQISRAKEIISREREEFESDKQRRLRDLGAWPPSRSESLVGEPKYTERTNRRESASLVSNLHTEKDDVGEMVHDEEDTVLY